MKQSEIKPEVGMGATHGVGSDCYAFTIVEIRKNRIVVTQDEAVGDVANGHDYFGSQKWILTPNPNGYQTVLSFRKKADCWAEVGHPTKYNRYFIGHRRFYQDPSF